MNRTEQAREILRKVFGYDAFRPGQDELIEDLLAGRDVLGVLPTGGGKSLCYQVPALCLTGTTLVISPLISLMKDQVDALDLLGVPASFINSSLSPQEQRERMRGVASGAIRILYLAPERLELAANELLRSAPVSFVAIDEAHCVSQWGHEFRPSYLKIREFIDQLPTRPLVGAYTATATSEVRQDILALLGLRDPAVHIASFDRSNLFFDVMQMNKKEKTDWLCRYIQQSDGQAGILYCMTRGEVEEVCAELRECGVAALAYHAGMEPEQRHANQDSFLYDKVQVMVATNAFGMGIDKSNVRFVIHFSGARSMESYYQEAGRAGRDGEPSDCILLFNGGDLQKLRVQIERGEDAEQRRREMRKLDQVAQWIYRVGCYRAGILDYFGEASPESCGNCGNCRRNAGPRADLTTEAQMIFSCIKRTGERFGATTIAAVLTGAKLPEAYAFLAQEKTHALLRGKWSERALVDLMRRLSAMGYLVVSQGTYATLSLGQNAYAVLRGTERVCIALPEVKSASKSRQKGAAPTATAAPARAARRASEADGDLSPNEQAVFQRLRALRKEISEVKRVPPYVVFTDSTLVDMARKRPGTLEEMLGVSGVGEVKLRQYGAEFLEALHAQGEAGPAADNAEHSTSAHRVPAAQPKPTRDIESSAPWAQTMQLALRGETADWSRQLTHDAPELRRIAARWLASRAETLARECNLPEDALMAAVLSALLRD